MSIFLVLSKNFMINIKYVFAIKYHPSTTTYINNTKAKYPAFYRMYHSTGDVNNFYENTVEFKNVSIFVEKIKNDNNYKDE